MCDKGFEQRKPRRVFPFHECAMCQRDKVPVYRWVIMGEKKGNWGHVHWYEFLCEDCAKYREDVLHEG